MDTEFKDLYSILELETSASELEIKANFKKLALKYHPDKNNNNILYNEKFNQIRIAYEILSNHNKKFNYDNMISSKKNYFCKIISSFIKKITNPEIINNIMNKPDIKNDIQKGKINRFLKKILNDIDTEIDISKLTDIFICTSSNDINTLSNNNQSNIYNSSDLNTLNIIASIKSNLDDVFNNRIKEIIVNRKIYNNDIITHETNKYYIPLYDNDIIINNAGDKIINNNLCGNVILKIIYKNNDNIIKDGYDLIFYDNITLNELFNGFIKKFDIFNSSISINSTNPFKDYIFDGEKLNITLKNKGFPKDNNNNRGDLIIILNLIKSDLFYKNIKYI